jgi:subtilisin family serine protease
VVVFNSPLGVFDDAGNGQYTSGNLRLPLFANEGAADVINMSLGGGGFPFKQARIYLIKLTPGVLPSLRLVTMAARSYYPASYDKVISVAAVDQEKKRASSRSNNLRDISVAGVRVASSIYGRYAYLSGKLRYGKPSRHRSHCPICPRGTCSNVQAVSPEHG